MTMGQQPSPYKGKARAKSYIPDGRMYDEVESFYKAIKPLMYNSERIDFALQTTKQLREKSNVPLRIISELVQQSQDWDFSQPAVDEKGEVIREPFDSWENFYKQEIEPIAGPYAEFVETYRKVIDGEISEDEGQEKVKKSARQLQAERNQKIHELREQGKTQQEIADEVGISQNRVSEVLSENSFQKPETDKGLSERSQENKTGKKTQWRIDKIRAYDPDLAAQCENKEIKVADAERQVGLAPTDYEKAVKTMQKLDSEQDLIKLQHEVKCRLNELNKEDV